MAVMLCEPTPAKLSLQVAVPATSACAPQPAMLTPPSWNVTVPVGVPEPGGLAVTVAVKVTLCPDTEGLAEELSAVVVASWPTVCVRGGDGVAAHPRIGDTTGGDGGKQCLRPAASDGDATVLEVDSACRRPGTRWVGYHRGGKGDHLAHHRR